MRKKKKESGFKTGLGMHGFFRVNIVDPDGSIAGDSGWKHNMFTNSMSNYITQVFLGSAGSMLVGMAAIGTGSVPATNATSLPGELSTSLRVTLVSASASRAASTAGDSATYTGSWVSGTSTATIGNVGLYKTTSANLLCGQSFATSSVASNQAILLTYNIVFVASSS